MNTCDMCPLANAFILLYLFIIIDPRETAYYAYINNKASHRQADRSCRKFLDKMENTGLEHTRVNGDYWKSTASLTSHDETSSDEISFFDRSSIN